MCYLGFLGASGGKESACSARDCVQSLSRKDPLQEGMATRSSLLAWRLPCTEELGGYSPWGHKEWDRTEGACMLACTSPPTPV